MNREPAALIAAVEPRPAIVVVAPWLYHLQCGIGGGVLCFRLLKHLAEHYRIHWVSFDVTANDPEAGKRALGEFCASVTTVALPAAPSLWRARVRQLLAGVPAAAQAMASPEMAAAIAGAVSRSGAIAAIFQFPQVAQYLGAASAVPVLMDTQDVCSVSIWREWRQASGARSRLAGALKWLAWARYELRHYARADLLLALSDTDAGVLRAFVPDVRCVVSPVATETGGRALRGAGTHVALVGNFAHPPNADGLRWLLEEIWPRVLAEQPQAELQVAGPGCPPASAALEAQGVHMRGFVDDIGAFFDAATVSLCPYRFGGGVKIKVLEAMARACPVVSTPIGSEGLGVVDGEHLSIAADAAGFARAVVRLLNEPALARRLGAAGQAHVVRNFSFQSKTAQVRQWIDQLAATRARVT